MQTSLGGLAFLQASHKPHMKKGLLMANGVADLPPLKPFPVRVMNLSKVPQFLPKGMVLSYVMPHPTRIVTLGDEAERSPTPTVEEDCSSQSESVDTPSPTEWKDEVDLSHLEPAVRRKVYHMLSKHASMWDGNLGMMCGAQHRIDLKPESRPVHCQQYRAGMRA